MDLNTISILLTAYSAEEVFGVGADPDDETLPTVLSNEQVLAAFRLHHIEMINRFEHDQRNRLLGGVHPSVIAEWGKKGPAAIAYLADGTVDSSLTAEASITGESLEDLSKTIAAKYNAYLSIGPKMTGMRRGVSLAIKEAGTPEDIVAIYNTARQQAQAAVDSIAYSMGVE